MLAWVGDLVSAQEQQAVSQRLRSVFVSCALPTSVAGTLKEVLDRPLRNDPRHPFPEEVWTTSFDLVERKDELRRAVQGPAPPPALPAEEWESVELTDWDWKEINKSAFNPILEKLSKMQTPGWHVGNNPFQVELTPENADARGFAEYFSMVPGHIDLPSMQVRPQRVVSEKVKRGAYRSVTEFAEHIHLMRENMVRFSSRMENLDKAADMLFDYWEGSHNLREKAENDWNGCIRNQKIKAWNRMKRRAQQEMKLERQKMNASGTNV